VVIVGTGETSELTARALTDSGCRTVFVASRRRERAISLARRYGGRSVSFDELPTALEQADIVVAATASPHLLLEAGALAEVMELRQGRPLLLIDLAVPRDIDALSKAIPGVSLYDIDDLEAVVARNRSVRQAEARKAEGIIEEEIQQFATWLGSLEVLPTVSSLRARATEIAEQVIRENDGKWESASARDLRRIEDLAGAIINRFLHEPTMRMKELGDGRGHARTALVRELFGLEAEPVPGEQQPLEREAPEGEQLAEIHELRRR
jgi:glutamyl-tRNA reductase